MSIQVERTFIAAHQSERIRLINELGHVLVDMTEPLVLQIHDANGKITFRVNDIDAKIKAAVELQEERHRVFLEAAKQRGFVSK